MPPCPGPLPGHRFILPQYWICSKSELEGTNDAYADRILVDCHQYSCIAFRYLHDWNSCDLFERDSIDDIGSIVSRGTNVGVTKDLAG